MARPVIFSKAKATIRPVERLSFLRVKPLLDFPRTTVKMPWEWMRPIKVVLPTKDEWRKIKERTLKKTALNLGGNIWNLDRGVISLTRYRTRGFLRL